MQDLIAGQIDKLIDGPVVVQAPLGLGVSR